MNGAKHRRMRHRARLCWETASLAAVALYWGMQRMRVIEIRDNFGVDSLQLVARPDRVPGPGQVVLKMKAFSINYRDLLVVNGVGPMEATSRAGSAI